MVPVSPDRDKIPRAAVDAAAVRVTASGPVA